MSKYYFLYFIDEDTQAHRRQINGVFGVVVVIRFWGNRGLEPTAKKEFLKTSLVQKGDFIKTWGQDLWAGRAALRLGWGGTVLWSPGRKSQEGVSKETFTC